MIPRITIDEMMTTRRDVLVLDVRTPLEFAKGHMPGAANLPLFTNEERVVVGTTYKQQSREAAILLGFELAGPKWAGFIRQALVLCPEKRLAVHCWRGGMRSGAMAWALDLYGFDIYLIEGGYKRYRNRVLRLFSEPFALRVLGGKTGSGKTRVLHELRRAGEQVIDLEELAQHCGSTYGTLNRLVQPTQEQFENNLADQLSRLEPNSKTWVEDESLNLGRCMIPRAFWQQIREAELFDLQVPAEYRVETLAGEYGVLDKDFLAACTLRIGKRLGTGQTKNAIAAIEEGRMRDFIRIVLVYYDKTYRKAMGGRDTNKIFTHGVSDGDPVSNARRLLDPKQ